MHIVGFTVRLTLLKTTCLGSNDSPRILTLHLNTTKGPATIISTYTLTLAVSTEEKEKFYGNLSAIVEAISKLEKMFLLGDFYARIGDYNTLRYAIIEFLG